MNFELVPPCSCISVKRLAVSSYQLIGGTSIGPTGVNWRRVLVLRGKWVGGLGNVFGYLSMPSRSAQSSLILSDPQLTSSCNTTDDEWFWVSWSSSQSLLRAKAKSKAALQMISNSCCCSQAWWSQVWLSSVRLARDFWGILIYRECL